MVEYGQKWRLLDFELGRDVWMCYKLTIRDHSEMNPKRARH